MDEGHEIGNHTPTDANISETADQQVRTKLHATQRLIESTTRCFTTRSFVRPTMLIHMHSIEPSSNR
jgi:hypothetical protein